MDYTKLTMKELLRTKHSNPPDVPTYKNASDEINRRLKRYGLILGALTLIVTVLRILGVI